MVWSEAERCFLSWDGLEGEIQMNRAYFDVCSNAPAVDAQRS